MPVRVYVRAKYRFIIAMSMVFLASFNHFETFGTLYDKYSWNFYTASELILIVFLAVSCLGSFLIRFAVCFSEGQKEYGGAITKFLILAPISLIWIFCFFFSYIGILYGFVEFHDYKDSNLTWYGEEGCRSVYGSMGIAFAVYPLILCLLSGFFCLAFVGVICWCLFASAVRVWECMVGMIGGD